MAMRREKVYILSKYLNRNKYKKLKVNALEGNGIINKDSYGYVRTFLEKREAWDLFFVWNGEIASEIAVKDYVKSRNKEILFFEVGNITNKVFVDPLGTNKRSILYKDIDILNKFEVSKSEFDNWKAKFISEKLNSHIVPQSTKKDIKYKIVKYMKFFFYHFEVILGIVSDYRHNYKYLLNVVGDKNRIESDKFNFDKKYIFFPLQVSNDAQIIINSKVDVLTGLKIALDIAKESGSLLVIKPHPAEQDETFIKKVRNFAVENNIIISSENTFKLIENSYKVVTINSTVGLEAKIMGKEVLFLGDSFYQKLNDNNLKNYILGYLIDCDYFGNNEISKETIEKILRRLNLTY
jgi:capsule polysaccharide modification protein KpsS